MKHTKIVSAALALLVAASAAMLAAAASASLSARAHRQTPQQSDAPPAAIVNDEGGPVAVDGEWAYTSYAIPTHVLEPVVALMDLSTQIEGDFGAFVPRKGQVLGTLTSPLAPAPAQYRIALPIEPQGRSIDLDNDATPDAGVQVYAVIFGSNLVGDSYLEQVEQGGEASVLLDPQTGALREGALLVHAPDAAQGFPSGAGADGVFFTEDDPIVTLPVGYTLATLRSDGAVEFDRSRTARMDVLEPVASASPDFAGQGILESYNSLIDLLAERYAYTDLRQIDWEQKRAQFLPAVQDADAAGDFAAYFLALTDLAQSIQDAHVQVSATGSEIKTAPVLRILDRIAGSLGAQAVELSDERFIVTWLDPEGPGAQAGWQFGTEIVAVDGLSMAERLETLPYLSAESTDEGVRLARMVSALNFPAGVTTTVAYRQPGASDVLTATLTVAEGMASAPLASAAPESISFRELDGGYGYIQWGAFDDPLYKVAVWEKFLSTFQAAPGIVIDLRGNGGGNLGLMYTLASYLFTPDEPAPLHWLDSFVYDEKTGDLVRELAADSTIHSPKPELTYSGAVVVLVDEGSASAAEYMPQFLQRQGRAVVVGEHGTDGAGGVIERAGLPGGITFQFTKGRTVFAGTDEYNLEGKGVTLDVRVPVTEEGEQAKLEGRDPVLEAAAEALAGEAARLNLARLTAAPWQWAGTYDNSARLTPVDVEEPYTISFAADGTLEVEADCNRLAGTYTLADGALTIALYTSAVDACELESQAQEFVRLLQAAAALTWDGPDPLITLQPDAGAPAIRLAPAPSQASAWDEVLSSWIGSGLSFCDAPGGVLLVQSPAGRYLKAAGVADLESQRPLVVDDRLQIGSNTKAFTVVLALQLAEEGLFSMDDRLADLLPDVAARIPNGDSVTLRQLAGNTSGIPDYADKLMQPIIDANDQEGIARSWTPEELIEFAAGLGGAEFAPDAGWHYSSTNFILLGMVVEAVTGRTLAELYAERIFAPLGMDASSYLVGSPEPGSIVEGYYKLPSGELAPMTNWNATQGGAAGAIVSTAEDMARFAEGLASGALFAERTTLDEMLAFRTLSAQEGGGVFDAYGLGLARFLVGGREAFGHGGQTPGFQSVWFHLPETQTTVVLLTNSGTCKALLLPLLLTAEQFGPEAGMEVTLEDSLAMDANASYVEALEAQFGAPAQSAFGSAVFVETLPVDAPLEEAALRWYRYFVGDRWEEYGEAAWMGPWQKVYTRPDAGERDVVAELSGLSGADVASSVDLLLNARDDAEEARAALSAAADDPDVTELAVWRIGDGEAMSGLLLAMRRGDSGEVAFLVFLMD